MTRVIKDQVRLTLYKPSLRVYVAGPYTVPDKVQNARIAIMAGNSLAELGFLPFIPHLNLLWELVCPQKYRFWLDYDFHWLVCCDAMLLLPGESKGAEEEVAVAKDHNIPVFGSISDLVDWAFPQKPQKTRKKIERNKA